VANFTLITSDKQVAKDQCLIYPNPANNQINILGLRNTHHKLVIFDMNGKQILNKAIKGSSATIDIGHLEPGVYLICIQNENGIHYRKIAVMFD
jgi:hypothetical protein